jgi:hypothetical protein
MRLGNFDEVKQETHRLPILFKVDCHGNIGLVIR